MHSHPKSIPNSVCLHIAITETCLENQVTTDSGFFILFLTIANTVGNIDVSVAKRELIEVPNN